MVQERVGAVLSDDCQILVCKQCEYFDGYIKL